jgi:hypothetical protein
MVGKTITTITRLSSNKDLSKIGVVIVFTDGLGNGLACFLARVGRIGS